MKRIPLTTYSAREPERFWSIAIEVGISGKNFDANDKIDSAFSEWCLDWHSGNIRVYRIRVERDKGKCYRKILLGFRPLQTQKRRNLGIFDDNFGREPETSLQPQYPKQEEVLGSNLWDSATDPEQPRQSNQQRLKQEFDRSE
jgi:hypothetical protein